MLKMLSTQLTGLFLKIKDKEELSLEDGGRLLAQAPAGEGKIYLKGIGEMEGVVREALEGAEPMSHAEDFKSANHLTHTDRVIIFSRFSDCPEAVSLGKDLLGEGIPFVSVSANRGENNEDLSEIADVHIDTHVIRPLLPADDGSRVVFPSLIAALYIYHALKVTIEEILFEYE
ncbi:Protein of uncharacterised function (DUF2529) [Bacillus freudenreichii]|nr:Protein of uncharacterised function (DUF2529) [Bacillus freudenreichii]